MTSINLEAGLESAATSPVRSGRKRRETTDPRLFAGLCRLFEAERQYAFDLQRLFRQSRSLPLRLMLSDRRREVSRQIVRLELLLRSAAAAMDAALDDDGVPTAPPADRRRDAGPAVKEADVPRFVLRTLLASMADYRWVVEEGSRLGQQWIADLLTTTLKEKRATVVVLAGMTA